MTRLSDLNQYFNTLDDLIKQVNSLNKSRNVEVTIEKRIDLLILCMTFVEKAQNDFLEFKKTDKSTLPVDLVQMDYKISEYANRFYKASLKIVQIFQDESTIAITNAIDINKRMSFLALSKRMLAISARWDIESFINFYEFDKPANEKAYPKRRPLLKDVIFYANRMNATKLGVVFDDGIMPTRIIFAVQPNSGKSFVVNVYSVIALIHHMIYYHTSGILRMSNNSGNACGFADQIKSMIEDEKIVSVFPELSKYFLNGKPKILEKTPSDEWKLRDLDPRIRASHFARGRDTAINSVRIFILLAIDDLSDGYDQMNNDDAHKAMTEKFNVDMRNRKEGSNIPDFIVGTMFNEFDIQNTMINRLERADELITDPNDDNIQYTKDYSTVVIRIDCFNKKGESVAPDLISTKELKELQEEMKAYQFDLVYRQIRSSREPRIFDWQNLMTYKKYPRTLEKTAIATLDPTRRSGNDYFAMPVFRLDTESNNYYFVNCIYAQKSLGRVYDPKNEFLHRVVRFIINNQITQLTLENNTSNTLSAFIEDELKKEGYTACKITEIYSHGRGNTKTSSVSKFTRILDMESTITNNIVFPDKTVLRPQTEMAVFMDQLTRFDIKENANKKTNHDDAPDAIAMFADMYLFNRMSRLAQITGAKKSELWKIY